MPPYEFINKSLFFPEEKILVVGDLHIGLEQSLIDSGVLIPNRQVKDIINDLESIFAEIGKKGIKVEKIVFLGDIKHAFYFAEEEKNDFRKVMDFLQNKISKENIILIKGNHDIIDYSIEKLIKPFHIENEILFVHGHKPISEAIMKKVKTIVMGHTHPCVIFTLGAKKEAYKCFLDGEYGGKRVIVLPSFFDVIEGTPVNFYKDEYVESFSLVPKKDIMKFKVHAISPDGKEVLEFGKIKDLQY